MNNKNGWLWPVMIKNSVAIASFVFLACWFDKWWIALFSALFITFIDKKSE